MQQRVESEIPLAGFVIHGNSRSTLRQCVESLQAVCDHVVCVDSGSTDGSAELVHALGARHVPFSWQGYGAARAHAMHEIPARYPYVMFLDSDEALDAASRAKVRAWRSTKPHLPYYSLRRDDWVHVGERTFRYRSEHRKRLIRRDHARWTPDMIVHESLPKAPSHTLDAHIDHLLLEQDIAAYEDKLERYALLWAIRSFRTETRRSAPPAHFVGNWFRDGVIKGAWFRGGVVGAQLSAIHARYHERKYERLADLRAGRYPELRALFERGDFGLLFDEINAIA